MTRTRTPRTAVFALLTAALLGLSAGAQTATPNSDPAVGPVQLSDPAVGPVQLSDPAVGPVQLGTPTPAPTPTTGR
ncbi:hypothetical protein [Deinococcus arcticus]|uniref:Uncharacterized protein n=1 Tax=Deinococcus arcticus TaxID=2136176 RepID=A0A2T3W5D3_9DEIO|nr:hypothetical protein [Deinococcus arcticus]PTA66973.1 hypothetical protein C8263_14745 [Deinococcus arcticus]